MFGLFKSKSDKEVESIVSEIRKNREQLIFEGNIVEDLANKVIKRYKLTYSIIEQINITGLLSEFEDSGYVVIAITEREAMYIKYDKTSRKTTVEMGSSTINMLSDITNVLVEYKQKGEQGHGVKYRDFGIINLVGAITALGYEVGIPEREDGNYLPFYFKGSKFYILDYDNASWIAFEE